MKTELKEKLNLFIGKCVYENILFPPLGIGREKVTIQELIHDYTNGQLSDYIDFLEKNANQNTRKDRLRGITEKTIFDSNLTFKEAVDVLDILLNDKIEKAKKEKIQIQIAELNKERETLNTPEERRAILDEKIKSLTESIN